MVLTTRQILNAEKLEIALHYLVKHHDALRLRFKQEENGVWKQYYEDQHQNDKICSIIDVSTSSSSLEMQNLIIQQRATTIQASLNIEKGPVFCAALFQCGDQQKLLLVIHHLMVDGVSWRILIEDLQSAYEQIVVGSTLVQLPAKTSSYKIALALKEYATKYSKELQEELNYWLNNIPVENNFSSSLMVDFDKGLNNVSSSDTVIMSLNKKETSLLLRQVPHAYNTQINDALLTALAQTINEWSGKALMLSLEGHGRENIIDDIDLLRTVGWFTSIFPVYLDLCNIKEIGVALKTVKEKLRSIPNRGIGFSILKYCGINFDGGGNNQIFSHQQPQISFNYLGQWDNVIINPERVFLNLIHKV